MSSFDVEALSDEKTERVTSLDCLAENEAAEGVRRSLSVNDELSSWDDVTPVIATTPISSAIHAIDDDDDDAAYEVVITPPPLEGAIVDAEDSEQEAECAASSGRSSATPSPDSLGPFTSASSARTAAIRLKLLLAPDGLPQASLAPSAPVASALTERGDQDDDDPSRAGGSFPPHEVPYSSVDTERRGGLDSPTSHLASARSDVTGRQLAIASFVAAVAAGAIIVSRIAVLPHDVPSAMVVGNSDSSIRTVWPAPASRSVAPAPAPTSGIRKLEAAPVIEIDGTPSVADVSVPPPARPPERKVGERNIRAPIGEPARTRQIVRGPMTEVERINADAEVAYRAGELERAGSLYQKAIALSPRFVPARLGAANVAWDAGLYGEARARYRALIADSPNLVPEVVQARAR